MAPKQFCSFDEFWSAISHSIKNGNRPSYHSCCRVWVGRFQKACRDSHIERVSWREALLSLKSSDTDPKALLLAHMAENQWGTPIYLNKPCTARVSVTALNQALEKCENPPAPQPAPEPLHFPSQHPAPTSPHSSPAQLQDLPPQTHLQPAALADPPKPWLETDSQPFNHR